jgi:hypothetical protein
MHSLTTSLRWDSPTTSRKLHLYIINTNSSNDTYRALQRQPGGSFKFRCYRCLVKTNSFLKQLLNLWTWGVMFKNHPWIIIYCNITILSLYYHYIVGPSSKMRVQMANVGSRYIKPYNHSTWLALRIGWFVPNPPTKQRHLGLSRCQRWKFVADRLLICDSKFSHHLSGLGRSDPSTAITLH